MALILCTGADPEAMKTRQVALEKAGHRVVAAMNQVDLMAACKEYEFDVVIIGQTLVPEMKQHVVDLIREHCSKTKILELYSVSENRAVQDADDWLEVKDQVPTNLAEYVSDLAQVA